MGTSRKILLNLALRWRMADRYYKLYNGEYYAAARTEAWNSYQAAKQIYYKDQ